MQDNEKHKIDDVFQKSMSRLSEEKPSASGWNNLKKVLQKEGIIFSESKNRKGLLWLSVFFAILLGAGSIAYYITNKSDTKTNINEMPKENIATEKIEDEKRKNENSNTHPVVLKEEKTNEDEDKIITNNVKENKTTPATNEASMNKNKKMNVKQAIGESSMLSRYIIRIATFGGQVNDPELNVIPNLKSEYFPKDNVTIFYTGGYKNKEEAIKGMEKIKIEFNLRIDPNDAVSQKNLEDAYKLFE